VYLLVANMRSLCIVVPRQEGEAVRKKLSDLGLLDQDLHIKRENELLLIPIRERPAPGELDDKYAIKEDDFDQRGARFKSYKDAVEGVPKDLLPLLPTSFDVVGDIALIKLPEELFGYGKKIGKAMLEATPSVRIVAHDKGVQGIERIRDLEVLAGEGGLVTVHREHGMRFEVDVSRCYFSPRLATERTRVATLVRDGERVLDMFAGVGPFSVLIAKTRKVEKVIAIDINPIAIEYLKKNILLNKVQNVEPVCADAKDFIKTVDPVDRVIMNLPHTGFEFLGDAILACAEDATIHFYEITDEAQTRTKDIEALAILLGRTAKVVGTREVRTYSPTESQWAFDIKVYIGQGSGVQAK
jgi:tRNA (guanine37-N1)-methyltransferase